MQFQKHTFILETIEALRNNGSWTGKTHVQKAISLIRDFGSVAVPFQYVLYKHGPYSFDIEKELVVMKSYDAIRIEPNSVGYGFMLFPGENASFLKNKFPLKSEEVKAINDICKHIGSRNVMDLERIATASWVRFQEKIMDTRQAVKRLRNLKPHISNENALDANKTIIEWTQ